MKLLQDRGNLLLLLLLAALYAACLYYPIIAYGYLVPPGDDPYVHLSELYRYAREGFHLNTGYPFGFHIVTYLVARLTGVELTQGMIMVYPALLLSSSLAVWYFVRRWYGPRHGLIAFLLYSFVAYQPLQTLYDGSFPNVFAAGTLIPIYLSFYLASFTVPTTRKRIISMAAAFLLAISILLTHHISTLYVIAVSAAALIPLLAVSLYPYTNRKRIFLWLAGTTALVAVILLLLNSLGLFQSAWSLASNYIRLSWSPPFVELIGTLADPAAIYHHAQDYVRGLGTIDIVLGLAGVVWLIRRIIVLRPIQPVDLLMVIWILVLYRASRIPELGYPVRAGRDLGLPLAIAGSVVLGDLWVWLNSQHGRIRRYIPALAVIGLLLVPAFIRDVRTKVTAMVRESPMIRFTAQDQAIISSFPSGSRVAVWGINQYHPFFRPDVRFQNLWWEGPSVTEFPVADYDYLLIETHDISRVWPPVMFDAEPFTNYPNMTLQATYPQPNKATSVYRITR